jgi:hypothetical protein
VDISISEEYFECVRAGEGEISVKVEAIGFGNSPIETLTVTLSPPEPDPE